MGDSYRRDDRGSYNKKRRFRDDDDHYDARPQRRRYEEPRSSRLRKDLYAIAEYSYKRPGDEIVNLARTVAEGVDAEDDVRTAFVQAVIVVTKEQPLKIPFLAAVVLAVNVERSDVVESLLDRAELELKDAIVAGRWREFKLLLRLLACMQGLFSHTGVFEVLDALFSRAAELQTASSEDTAGLELVHLIQLTLPYIMASSADETDDLAAAMLEKTDIIASAPHTAEELIEIYPFGQPSRNAAALLQSQLQIEASDKWPLKSVPRPWRDYRDIAGEDRLANARKHSFPLVELPDFINPGKAPLFPELFFSVYSEQDIDSVPPLGNIASSLVRDVLTDTITCLDFNRNAAAKCLVDLDNYFPAKTFVRRATQFDRLKEVPEGDSTWKPEDVAIDAVFAQLLLLPSPEHKSVYYHSLLTELCKLAPTAFAPSLGRVIRFMYRSVDKFDIEVTYRFLDWFCHHLSNFGFTWKWTEWAPDLERSEMHPRKAFIEAALDKETRLSFPARIRGTLPESYTGLVPELKDQDVPDFKFEKNADLPYAADAVELLGLLRKRAPEEEIQVVIDRITAEAKERGEVDPLLATTDVYMTCICSVGAKSLSHVLSSIERSKERLLAIGPTSPAARKQIISAVMSFWSDNPGVGVSIIDKLLNYTILTPMSVTEWAFTGTGGDVNTSFLSKSWIFEIVSKTVFKVTHRLRQLVIAKYSGIPEDQKPMIDQSIAILKDEQTAMFKLIDETMTGILEKYPAVDGEDDGTEERKWMRFWAEGWKRVFSRKAAVEDAAVALLHDQGSRAEEVRAQTRNGNGSSNSNGAMQVDDAGNGVE